MSSGGLDQERKHWGEGEEEEGGREESTKRAWKTNSSAHRLIFLFVFSFFPKSLNTYKLHLAWEKGFDFLVFHPVLCVFSIRKRMDDIE